jgi:transketolase
MTYTKEDTLAVQAIRALSIDAVEKANSGHPGLPMGAAPMAYVLWSRFLKHSAKQPNWLNRDRFVLSAGHGSMLLYSLLHLFRYDVSMKDLQSFRQFGSKTPGHPEFGHTPGIDTTTGPLGQGIATAVGFAMAERFMAGVFNKPNHELINHHTYVIVGDGDLMEGISSEASSFAGHLGLHKLIVLYDSNDISLDGPTSWSFTEDVKARYRAYGWNVLRVEDGNNLEEIDAALSKAQAMTNGPTLIEVKTIIGYGSGKQGTSAVHGSPLGPDEVKKARATYGWNHDAFEVPKEVYDTFAGFEQVSEKTQTAWDASLQAYRNAFPEAAIELDAALAGHVNVDFAQVLPKFEGGVATRDAFGKIINAIAPLMPTLLGGSADLSGSNKTNLANTDHFQQPDYTGKNVFYGVREHAMGAMLNGLSLHGGVFPFGGTFLVFCDYLRPAIRLAALMKQPVLYVFTHDSIAVGEDGPTHQPVEQLASLRVIPGLKTFRPADGTETGLAVQYALTHRDAPVALALTRQKLETMPEVIQNQENFFKGGYVLFQEGDGEDLVLLASGSEVNLILDAGKQLAAKGVAVRVLSFPCLEVFEAQSSTYKEQVLPASAKLRLAVEMAHPMPWYRYVGTYGQVLGIDHFGASGPGEVVMKAFGFTVENVLTHANQLLGRS